jgi:hypothetical protein
MRSEPLSDEELEGVLAGTPFRYTLLTFAEEGSLSWK